MFLIRLFLAVSGSYLMIDGFLILTIHPMLTARKSLIKNIGISGIEKFKIPIMIRICTAPRAIRAIPASILVIDLGPSNIPLLFSLCTIKTYYPFFVFISILYLLTLYHLYNFS
jgi:hypothetical protein